MLSECAPIRQNIRTTTNYNALYLGTFLSQALAICAIEEPPELALEMLWPRHLAFKLSTHLQILLFSHFYEQI